MKKLIIILCLISLGTIGYFFYNMINYLYITADFDELEPFQKNMKVYFKGFKIGQATKIYPNENYTKTFLKLKLHKRSTNFPENIKANIKMGKTGGYVDIVYPDEPVIKRLKNNSSIQGTITKDINSILDGKFSEDDIDLIFDDATVIMKNVNSAIENLNRIFIQVNRLISDIEPDIKLSCKNLSQTTSSLNELAKKTNNSINEEDISSSLFNIKSTTDNIKSTTQNISEITENINKNSMPKINGILTETNCTMRNAKEITGGIKNTLKKRMGLSRLLFGKPVRAKCE